MKKAKIVVESKNLFIIIYLLPYKKKMSADLQTFMARRGAKAMGLVLLLSCLALLAKYYTYEPNSSHFRRALFYRNDSSIQQGQFNSHFSWTDGNGKFLFLFFGICIILTHSKKKVACINYR